MSKIAETPQMKKSLGEIKDKQTSVLLFLIVRSKVKNLMSEIAFIEDYLSFFIKCRHEKKILKNLKDAVDLIFSYNY